MSVPGVGTARPSACADQPSRRSTACRGTTRGRPRRRWRARRPPRAARRRLLSGVRERGHPASTFQLQRIRPRRLAARSPCEVTPTSRRHTGTRRTWPAWPRRRCARLRAPSRHRVSCQRSPCVGCCASTTAQTRWRRMEAVEVRVRQSRTSRQAWLAPCGDSDAGLRLLPPVRAWPKVCRGGESAD